MQQFLQKIGKAPDRPMTAQETPYASLKYQNSPADA
jgi:hypothetical protein